MRPNFIDLPAYMQVGQRRLSGQNVEIMNNAVRGVTADTAGTITLKVNEITVTNTQPNWEDPQGYEASANYGWSFNAVNHANTIRLQTRGSITT